MIISKKQTLYDCFGSNYKIYGIIIYKKDEDMKFVYFLLLLVVVTPCFGQNQNDSIKYGQEQDTEINKIKKEGSSYQNSQVNDYGDEEVNKYMNYTLNTDLPSETTQTPMFASDKFAGYGKSKYDKGLTFFDEEADNAGSLEKLRAEQQNAELKEVGVNTLLGIGISLLIIILIKRCRH